VAYTLGVAVECVVLYTGVISHPNERHPMNTTEKMTIAELPEAVQVYAAANFDPRDARPLMELLFKQTDYIQKRFFKMAEDEEGNW
jgi:hypothetical protein